jgi:hypothetical protein
MDKIQKGDVVRWRGLHGHEGVVVHLFGDHTTVVCYADGQDFKDAATRDLQLMDGPIDDEMQAFIDSVTAEYLR